VDGFAASPDDAELRGVPRHRRVDLLPPPSGRAHGLRARAHRAARQGLGDRHGRRQPPPGPRLRHRLPPGPHPPHRALVLHRGGQPARPQQRPLGDEAYVVARYEFTPGFEDLDAAAVGGTATTGSAITCAWA
jgi:hypothetical protein